MDETATGPAIKSFFKSYGWLIIVSMMLAAFYSAYIILGMNPSSRAYLLLEYTLPICFATWVQADARNRRCTPCFDFGMFVAIVWSIAVPWYLIKTRRWWGVLLTLMFAALVMLPSVVATLVWIFLYSF